MEMEPIPEHSISQVTRTIIMQMMSPKPEHRPKVQEILDQIPLPHLTKMERLVFQPPGKGMDIFKEKYENVRSLGAKFCDAVLVQSDG